jgi:hypothetical protein
MNIKSKLAKSESTISQAANFLIEKGYVIADRNHPFANGVDFTAIKNNRTYSVEVKPVRVSCGAWKVDPIGKARRADALVALVFKSGHVQIESMKDHLKLCAKDGSRSMSALGWFYE